MVSGALRPVRRAGGAARHASSQACCNSVVERAYELCGLGDARATRTTYLVHVLSEAEP